MFSWQHPSQSAFDADGRIQPLNVKKGELSNRIITCGDPNRALRISKLLDPETLIIRQSNMFFCTYTGMYKGCLVSIIATGMGFAMVELMAIQARAVVDGPLVIVRLGTCGSLHEDVPIGCFALADRTYFIRQEYEADPFPFEVCKKPLYLDAELNKRIMEEFGQYSDYRTVMGPNFAADTFYPSQGRLDGLFNNENSKVIPSILETEPEALFFEMEAYLLAFLAQLPGSNMRTACICITLAQRTATGDFLDNESKYAMEIWGGRVLLEMFAKDKIKEGC